MSRIRPFLLALISIGLIFSAAVESRAAPSIDGHQALIFRESRGAHVVKLRCLLEGEGVLQTQHLNDEEFDVSLVKAVKAFQIRAGLKPVGNVRQGTLQALKNNHANWQRCLTGENFKVFTERHVDIPAKKPAQQSPRPVARPTKPVPGVPARIIRTPEQLDRIPHDAFVRGGMEVEFRRAIEHYTALVSGGGWKSAPRSYIGQQFKLGDESEATGWLCQRLVLEKYLTKTDCSSRYTPILQKAFHHFKHRHQLEQNDWFGGVVRSFFNVTASQKLHSLKRSRARHMKGPAQKVNFTTVNEYIVVNIPAGRTQYVSKGKVSEYLTVLGKASKQSPDLLTHVNSVTFFPTWTPPISYRRAKLDPKYKDNPARLKASPYRVFKVEKNGTATKILPGSRYGKRGTRVIRRPGVDNPLGMVRIDMPNKHYVFLHSTSNFGLFDRAIRYKSLGCARVDGILDLVSRMFRDTGTNDWSEQDIYRKLGGWSKGGWKPGPRVRMNRKIPVLWVYYTAWPAQDGTVEYRRDRYNRDT